MVWCVFSQPAVCNRLHRGVMLPLRTLVTNPWDLLGKGMKRVWDGAWNEMGHGLAQLNCWDYPSNRLLHVRNRNWRKAGQCTWSHHLERNEFTHALCLVKIPLVLNNFLLFVWIWKPSEPLTSATILRGPNGCNKEHISKVQYRLVYGRIPN